MSKKYLLGVTGLICLLTFLFLASSTDLIFKEKEALVYEVSVLVDSADDSGWENFKLGMDKAAGTYNMDISFITLYDGQQPVQQLEQIVREISGGAQGLILSLENPVYQEEAIDTIPLPVPVIVIGSSIDSPKIKGVYSWDYEAMARLLYEKAGAEYPDKNVMLVTSGQNRNNLTLFESELGVLCAEDNRNFSHMKLGEANALAQFLGGLVFQEDSVLIIPELSILSQVSRYAYENNMDIPLYGAGWSNTIWHRVEDGTVNAVAVADSYGAGYSAVKELYEYLSRTRATLKEPGEVPLYIINKDNLYDSGIEAMLFPKS